MLFNDEAPIRMSQLWMWHLVILIQASYHVSWNCDLFSAHLSYLLGQLLDGVVIEFRTKMACHDSVIFFFFK